MKIEGHIYKTGPEPWASYQFSATDMSEHWIQGLAHTIEFEEFNHIEVVAKAVQILREEQRKARVAAHEKDLELEGKIQELLALPAPSMTEVENDIPV